MGLGNIQEEVKKNKSMDGPQGLDTLLETLSTNKKTVKTGKSKKGKKKGLDF
jgi:hypothetical protein